MAEAVIEKSEATAPETSVARIYEIGYHISPSVKEEDVEKTVSELRKTIEQQGGTFIAEGAPSTTRLAYAISSVENGKRIEHDRAYFGWIKFEAPSSASAALDEALKQNASVLRHIVFRTVREETRASLRAPHLREVRRTDTIKTTPKREEASAPVSEADLDKALEDITAE